MDRSEREDAARALAETNMVERVAMAIAEEVYDRPLDGMPNGDFQTCLDAAKAAVMAMREPTETMKHANDEVHWGYSCAICGGLTEGWYAMIDAALSPPASSK